MKKVLLFFITQTTFLLLFSQSSEKMRETARHLFDSKKYIEALPIYSKLIALNEPNDSIYYYRGICKYQIKDYKGAIDDISHYLVSDSINTRAYLYRGESKIYNNDTIEGLQDFQKAIELEPKESYVRVWRGDVFSMIGWMKKGINEFDTAIMLNQNDFVAHFYKAYNLKCQGETELAFKDIKIAYEYDSTDINFALLYGKVKRDLGNYNEALAIFTKIIVSNPNNAEAYLNRAYTYSLMKEEKQSNIDLKIAASLGSEKAKGILKDDDN